MKNLIVRGQHADSKRTCLSRRKVENIELSREISLKVSIINNQ